MFRRIEYRSCLSYDVSLPRPAGGPLARERLLATAAVPPQFGAYCSVPPGGTHGVSRFRPCGSRCHAMAMSDEITCTRSSDDQASVPCGSVLDRDYSRLDCIVASTIVGSCNPRGGSGYSWHRGRSGGRKARGGCCPCGLPNSRGGPCRPRPAVICAHSETRRVYTVFVVPSFRLSALSIRTQSNRGARRSTSWSPPN